MEVRTAQSLIFTVVYQTSYQVNYCLVDPKEHS